MRDRDERLDLLAEVAGEAMPYGRLVLTVFAADDPLSVLSAMAVGDASGRALAEALPGLLSGEPRRCGACGGDLDALAAIAVLHADRPDATAALALGCCAPCTDEGPAGLRRGLMAFLGTIFTGLRAISPTHAPPSAIQ